MKKIIILICSIFVIAILSFSGCTTPNETMIGKITYLSNNGNGTDEILGFSENNIITYYFIQSFDNDADYTIAMYAYNNNITVALAIGEYPLYKKEYYVHDITLLCD